MTDAQARELAARLEALLAAADEDPLAGPRTTEAVGAAVELYGEGLARIVAHVAGSDDGTLARALAGDELVAHLLALHDLHPVPVAERVAGALEEVRPYLASHGGDVELLGVQEGVARLRLEGSCSGCPSSTMTLKLAIEDAILKAAPEIVAVEAQDGERGPGTGGPPGLIGLEVLACPAEAAARPAAGAA